MLRIFVIVGFLAFFTFNSGSAETAPGSYGQTYTLEQLLKDLTCSDCDYSIHNRAVMWLGNTDNNEIFLNEDILKGIIALINNYSDSIKNRIEKGGKNERLGILPDEDYANYLFALSYAAGKFNDDRFIEPLLKMNSENVYKYGSKPIELILKYYDAGFYYPGTSKWALVITLKNILENNKVNKGLMDRVVDRFVKELHNPSNKQNFRLRIISLLEETKNPAVIPELLKYKNEIFKMDDEIIDGKKVSFKEARKRNKEFYYRIKVKPETDGSKMVKLYDGYLKVNKNGNIYEHEPGDNKKAGKGGVKRSYYPEVFKDTVEKAVKKLEKYRK